MLRRPLVPPHRPRAPHTVGAALLSGLVAALTLCAEEPYRPTVGKFPAADQAKLYQGELVFVDHANRRGSLRLMGGELFHSTAPHPFAMLPYGMLRYHGAPADLRDIPLGTMLHGQFYLPPDPANSSVPSGQPGSLTDPAENHAGWLEDEPSFCLRTGKVWQLKSVEFNPVTHQGLVVAIRTSKENKDSPESEQRMSIDGATRFWRGREKLGLSDLIAEGLWPASGQKNLGQQAVHLSIAWKPAGTWERRVGNRMHISDIWLDAPALERAAQQQAQIHQEFIRSRWMPAYVDAVEYGKFGEAVVTATLFGGMDPALYADFKPDIIGQIAVSEFNLKHSEGWVGHYHMAIKGPILDVTKPAQPAPPGSSGIQLRVKVDLVLEGFRPGRIVRIRPLNWPDDAVPREEYTAGKPELRSPPPVIFPKY